LVEVPVSEGQPVVEGQVVAVLESMKMNLELRVPIDGVVEHLYYAVGEEVEQGAVLIRIEPGEG
jgi:3-methylcrotonyl-CoA carboxylase alpha subunit